MNTKINVALPDTGRFDDDATQSFTLPGKFYFDADIYGLEQEKIFYKSWQYVCHVTSIEKPGSYWVRDIGDQSVIVVRDRNDELRAFHNVCQHRAHRLLEGTGRVGSSIVCPYHTWTYSLSGELLLARHSDEVVDFDKGDVCLAGVRLEMLCGFVFINLDPDAAPLMDGLEAFDAEVRELSPSIEKLRLANTRKIELKANWKNSVENYSECYHCPNQHPGLAEGSLDMDSYQITVHDKFHSHASRGVGDKTQYARSDAASNDEREFGSWLLWPNWVIEVYPGGFLNVFHHIPDGPEKTVQVCEWYFEQPEPSKEQQAVVEFVDGVREEDIPLCETVQKGLHSLGYTQGRFMANKDRSYFSEHAVHDFQKKVLKALKD